MSERPKFTGEECTALLVLNLFPEQVRRLEVALLSIKWRLQPAPTMTDVREELSGLANALARVEKCYMSLCMPKSAAAAEASTRLYVPEDVLEAGHDKLHDSLEIAGNVVNRALADLPKEQRRDRVDGAGIIRLILNALELGHTEHFNCAGYGETPIKEVSPPFEIYVTRDVEPFASIVRILSVAAKRISEENDRARFAVKVASVPPPNESEAFDPEWAIRQYRRLLGEQERVDQVPVKI